MSSLRNHARPASSLKERLLKFAEDARAAAQLIAPSREQDELLRTAQRAETLAIAADRLGMGRLRSSGPRILEQNSAGNLTQGVG